MEKVFDEETLERAIEGRNDDAADDDDDERSVDG